MKRFLTVYSIELKKLAKRKISLVFVILIIALSVFVNAANYYVMEVFLPQLEEQMPTDEGGVEIEVPGFTSTVTYEEQRQSFTDHVKVLEELKAQNSSDFRDRDYQNAKDSLVKINYELANGIAEPDDIYDVFGTESNQAWKQVAKGATSMGQMVLTFAIVLMSLAIAGEYEKGTLKSLITRPAGRSAILYAKFSAVFTYAILLQILNWVVNLLMYGAFFGFGNPFDTQVFAMMGQAFAFPAWAAGLIFHLVEVLSMLLPLAVTLLLAVATRSNAGTIGISLMMIYILNPLLSQLASFVKVLRFSPFIHMQNQNYLTAGIAVDHTSFLFSTIAAFLYLVVFLVAAQIIFKKRDI